MKNIIILGIFLLSTTACVQTQHVQKKVVVPPFECVNKKNGEHSRQRPGTIFREAIVCKGGKKHGRSTLHHLVTKALMIDENYKNGKKDGRARIYHKNGRLDIESIFNNGKSHGVSKRYFDNGNLKKTGNFIHGFKDGLETAYYLNGNVSFKANWENGVVHGTLKDFSKSGKLVSKILCKKGIVIKYYNYDANGKETRDKSKEGKSFL